MSVILFQGGRAIWGVSKSFRHILGATKISGTVKEVKKSSGPVKEVMKISRKFLLWGHEIFKATEAFYCNLLCRLWGLRNFLDAIRGPQKVLGQFKGCENFQTL